MGRRLLICNVSFESGGDGHYYSEGGRYAVFHMLRGTAQACWELWEIAPPKRHTSQHDYIDMIDSDTHLSLLRHRGTRGDFALKDSR